MLTIPLPLAIFLATMGLAVVGYLLRLIVFDRMAALEKQMKDAIDELKKDMKESAKGQGERLGEHRADIKMLLDWRSETRGAAERERELSGVVRR